jgi:hypothetical protein
MALVKSSALYMDWVPIGTLLCSGIPTHCGFEIVMSKSSGQQVAQWLECWTSNRKVARSNPRADKVKKSVVLPLNKAVNPLFLSSQ